jgi:hypothetical protein
MATDFDWSGFSALAKRLDDLVVGQRDDAEFAEDLRRALTFVYTAGVTMPTAGDVFEDAGGDEFWENTLALDLGRSEPDAQVVADLAERIATSVAAVQPEADADAEELADLAEVAAHNVLDAVSHLADGAAHFEASRLQEAAWEWSFQFDDWGAYALAALIALHELLWGAR